MDYETNINSSAFIAKTASEFGDRQTVYIWYPYIVKDEINITMASGGSGKTYFSCLVAAYITTGKALPGDFKPPNGAQNVLLINGEETGELLKERLSACNADLEKVFILDLVDSVGLDFRANPKALQELIQQYHPALTVIDPLQSFIGEEADLNRMNVIRPIMQRLSKIAKEEDTAILLVMHVNKRPQTNNLNDSANGSSDFVNASRSALYLARDEEYDNSRLVIHSKVNYSAPGKTVRFTFDNKGGIYWNGYSDIDRYTIEEANRKRKTPGEIVKSNAVQTETNETLIRALLDASDKKDPRRYSYDSFKERYGIGIFGAQQPKRLLDSIASAMFSRGFKIETGIKVKDGAIPKNGFAIVPTTTENYTADITEQLSMVDDL